MKVLSTLLSLMILQLCGMSSCPAQAQQSITLHAPRNKETNRYDESRSWFGFAAGLRNDQRSSRSVHDGDLGYGFLAIDGRDFFSINHGPGDRSVIKDLGKHAWEGSFDVPALTPLPALKGGETRHITVDASAETGEAWRRKTKVYARAEEGHMYAVRIKKGDTDLYALFWVEELEQGRRCTISWVTLPFGRWQIPEEGN